MRHGFSFAVVFGNVLVWITAISSKAQESTEFTYVGLLTT